MKNLVRNGGFERNTIDFWTAFDAKSFAAVAAPVHKGSYAGKLVADGSHTPYVTITDFIEIGVGEDLYFEGWFRSSHSNPIFLKALYYDENLDLVDTVTYKEMTPSTTAYEQMLETISGMESAMYVSIQILHNHTAVDHYTLIDNVLMYRSDPTTMSSRRVLMESQTGLSAAGTLYGDYIFVQPFREAEFVLDVITCLGAAETLDVEIVSYDRLSAFGQVIATFEQAVDNTGDQVLLITGGLGTKIRTKSVVGGAPTNITYNIEGNFKR